MPRVKRGNKRLEYRKKILKRASGYYGARSRLYRTAEQAVEKAGVYAYAGRKMRKRDFRRLWNTRINAAAREHDLSYSQLLHGLGQAGVVLNRKMLAAVAVEDPAAFTHLVDMARSALAG
ncbi:MAG: 50S ribosomal protein L20 [Acidobacteriota bacterium]